MTVMIAMTAATDMNVAAIAAHVAAINAVIAAMSVVSVSMMTMVAITNRAAYAVVTAYGVAAMVATTASVTTARPA